MVPMVRNATRVARADLMADGGWRGSPCSSWIMVSTQRFLSEVMVSTTCSRVSPSKPLALKIWRISSRSPSGWFSISSSSSRRYFLADWFSARVPEKFPAAMEKPSASMLAMPRTMTRLLERPAPATEETTAKVVTAPSIAPRMESFR